MVKLLRPILLIALCITSSACISQTKKYVQKRNEVCGKDLTIPKRIWDLKSEQFGEKTYVPMEAIVILSDHAGDLAECLKMTQCIIDIKQAETECAEDYIDKLRGRSLPALSIRPRCEIKLKCMGHD